MLKRYHHIVGGTFRIVDMLVIGLVWICCYFLRFHLPIIEVTKGLPPFEQYASLAPLVMVLWALTFSTMKLYRSRRMLRRTHEAQLIFRAHAIALLAFIAITYLFSEYKYSRLVVIYFGFFGAFSLIFVRLLLRNILRSFRKKGYNLRHAVVVGNSHGGAGLIKKLERFPEMGIRVVGCLLNPTSTQTESCQKPVLGNYQEIKKIIHKHNIDFVIIALPRTEFENLDPLLDLLKDEAVDIKLIPDIHDYITLGCEVEDFDGSPIVNINDSPMGDWAALIKRATDFILSLIALILLSPIFILISISIKLTSKGPVFYQQKRMGLDGKTFEMFKFRSMVTNAEVKTGAVWANASDNRKTKLGSFLRSTSLDELPQFWNTFRGDMSLVGPRPERPHFVEQFKKEIPHYMLRHKVKAGITGWAQINGWRGNTSLQKRIEHDIYYIKNWSYILDIKILFLTLIKGFINKNAY